MKRGPKHAGPKHAAKPAQAAIPEHIAALGIVKSVRPDGSYVCIHDQELTECDECAPLALLADEEASVPVEAGVEIAGTQEEGVGSFGALPPIEDSTQPATCAPPDDGLDFSVLGRPMPGAAAIFQARLVEDSAPRTEYQIHAEFPAPAVRPTLVHDPLASPAEPMPADLSVACAALGLASEHVLTHAIRGDGSVSIITRGGARLAWPCTEEQRQAALALIDQQRDGLIRDNEGNILPRGKWLTTPHKF